MLPWFSKDRKNTDDPTSSGSDGSADTTDAPASQAQRPKGRPTPSRKEAESQRKQALKVPKDPKAAKKAMKKRERESKSEARAGMMAGDEKYLPKRDQGPAKAYTRDVIDSRRRMAEFFVFVAIGILIAGFIEGQSQNLLTAIWFITFGGVVLEVTWVMFRLSTALKKRWPDRTDRKGCIMYGLMRQLQIRKLRVPAPRIKAGDDPIEPRGTALRP